MRSATKAFVGAADLSSSYNGSCDVPILIKLTCSFVLGYNATVLAYGQTGSGKTHSMGTVSTESTPLELEGTIPRAIREIFHRISNMPSYDFSVKVAFVELYKEQLYDLLSTQVSPGIGSWSSIVPIKISVGNAVNILQPRIYKSLNTGLFLSSSVATNFV